MDSLKLTKEQVLITLYHFNIGRNLLWHRFCFFYQKKENGHLFDVDKIENIIKHHEAGRDIIVVYNGNKIKLPEDVVDLCLLISKMSWEEGHDDGARYAKAEINEAISAAIKIVNHFKIKI